MTKYTIFGDFLIKNTKRKDKKNKKNKQNITVRDAYKMLRSTHNHIRLVVLGRVTA